MVVPQHAPQPLSTHHLPFHAYYTGEKPEAAARRHGIDLLVVKLPEARRGFVLLPRRWVVERRFPWAARFRRPARDYERLPQTLAGFHFVALACLMVRSLMTWN